MKNSSNNLFFSLIMLNNYEKINFNLLNLIGIGYIPLQMKLLIHSALKEILIIYPENSYVKEKA